MYFPLFTIGPNPKYGKEIKVVKSIHHNRRGVRIGLRLDKLFCDVFFSAVDLF